MKYEAVFNTYGEIKAFYECFKWKMKGRSNDRSKIHVENILFAEVILKYLNRDIWSYPVTVYHHDRPDFMIKSSAGNIGVEVTEQWSENYGHALYMLENSSGLMEPTDFEYSINEKKIKGKDIAKLVSKTKLTGLPIMGYDAEIDWIKRTTRTIKIKASKYLKYPNYNSFDKNMLVIFDVRPEPVFFEDISQEMLNNLFSYGELSPFDTILCLDNYFVTIDINNKIFEFEKSRRGNHL